MKRIDDLHDPTGFQPSSGGHAPKVIAKSAVPAVVQEPKGDPSSSPESTTEIDTLNALRDIIERNRGWATLVSYLDMSCLSAGLDVSIRAYFTSRGPSVGFGAQRFLEDGYQKGDVSLRWDPSEPSSLKFICDSSASLEGTQYQGGMWMIEDPQDQARAMTALLTVARAADSVAQVERNKDSTDEDKEAARENMRNDAGVREAMVTLLGLTCGEREVYIRKGGKDELVTITLPPMVDSEKITESKGGESAES
ncbi:hypothetical protein FWD20_03575 [Candidatus Saccharibacteria bacterium]|nr:hypothetical protein [Candidatus Saccharibacteria bacterium]